MTLPHFNILTQREITIDLSRPAMEAIVTAIDMPYAVPGRMPDSVQCEIDNFRNTLLNLLERSEPENLDLVGG